MQPSEDQDLSVGDKWIGRPLDRSVAGLIIKFLTSNPGFDNPGSEKFLSVIDLKPEPGQQPKPGDGRLVIGQNDTLQVQSGVNRLALILHPERFQFDERSVGVVREAIRARALTAAVSEPIDDGSYGEALRSRPRPETPQDIAKKQLVAKLGSTVQSLSGANLKVSDDGNMATFTCGKKGVEEIMGLAARSGFQLEAFKHPKSSANRTVGIGGINVATMLNDVLFKNGRKSVAERLKQADRHNCGVFAVIFGKDEGLLFLANKHCALSLQ